ncbi:MAG: DNA-processing protein DprA [Spirochaetes bacterium]|nr:DNA-processing protein DprA [Spirochaetota bacterium]
MSSNTKYWIALGQSKGIGPANLNIIYQSLKTHNLSISDIFSLSGDEIKHEFQFNDKIIEALTASKSSLSRIEDIYFELLDSGIETILFFEESYPARLKTTAGTSLPPILYSYGNKKLLNEKGAAIIGEKELSDRGADITYFAAKEIIAHKIIIISGLARGADEIAHRSALENGGQTIAMLPYGIRHLKIPHMIEHVYNQDNILIVSPFYPDTEYNKFNAYIRNRIICALSCAVYIVECPGESGMLEAAKSAHKLNVPLFVTEYAVYPESASANGQLITEFSAIPVKGKMVNNILTPNMDKLIGIVKFS